MVREARRAGSTNSTEFDFLPDNYVPNAERGA
jgi:hypothetical protein